MKNYGNWKTIENKIERITEELDKLYKKNGGIDMIDKNVIRNLIIMYQEASMIDDDDLPGFLEREAGLSQEDYEEVMNDGLRD